MACSQCGNHGHNARSCPNNPQQNQTSSVTNGRDRMIIAIDNTDEESLHEIAAAVMKAKRQIDPDARGTIVIGDERSLPHKVLALLNQNSPSDE